MTGTAISNPNGAYGYTDLQTKLPSEQDEFSASAVIADRAVVALSSTGTVATALTNGVAATAFGIAVQPAAAAGEPIQVVTYGIAENVPCAGAVAHGDILKASATTAGRVSTTATPAAGEAIGFAIGASTANTVDVFVIKSL